MDNVEYVYAVIPARYACLYHKLLVLLAEFGVDMLNDCNATCKGNNKHVITCYTMFNAGVAAYNLGETKKAETIMKYVNAQVKIIFAARGRHCPLGEFKIAASEDGSRTAYVSCNGETATFRVEDTPESNIISGDAIQNVSLTDEDFNEN